MNTPKRLLNCEGTIKLYQIMTNGGMREYTPTQQKWLVICFNVTNIKTLPVVCKPSEIQVSF